MNQKAISRKYRRNLTMLAVAMLQTATLPAQDTITLPLWLCNQAEWKATETTVTLDEESEELPAWELQDFESYTSEQRKGKVYYVDNGLDDRIILLFKEVNIRTARPYIIDNPTEKDLIIRAYGRTQLSSDGCVVRSQGAVHIIGLDKDSLDFDNLITIYSKGRMNSSAIDVAGDVSLTNLNLNMKSNQGSYGIMCRKRETKEPSVLIFNNVKGNISGTKGSTFGFDIIEGTRCEVEGVDERLSDDSEQTDADEAEQTDADEAEQMDADEAEQSDPDDTEQTEERTFVVVESPASFPGGAKAQAEFVANNLEYPVLARETGVQGHVIVNFIVEKDGSLTNIKVVRGVDPSLDKAAVKIIEKMPKWTPAKQGGVTVRSEITIPVNFRLNADGANS